MVKHLPLCSSAVYGTCKALNRDDSLMAEAVNKLKHALEERGPAHEGLNNTFSMGSGKRSPLRLSEMSATP